MPLSSKNTKTVYRDDKALVDINDPAELVTCLLMANSSEHINFDAMYASLATYFNAVDQVSMDGLRLVIKEAIRLGKDYDSNELLPRDVFN